MYKETKLLSVEISEEKFNIYFSDHASKERCIERGVSEYAIASLVVAIGDHLFSLTKDECKGFCIFDDVLGEGAVCSMDYNVDENVYEIDIITVIRTNNVFMKKGQRILKYSECVKFDK